MTGMIRRCTENDFEAVLSIINDAASAYKGAIPPDCYHEPYMPAEELRQEINDGVEFWGYEEDGGLAGVMGMQEVLDVTLFRHAYVRSAKKNRGIGGHLIGFLKGRTARPVLVGTWAEAYWAIRFYEKHGFRLVRDEEHARLLNRYWKISPRQVETSVVLADEKWFERF